MRILALADEPSPRLWGDLCRQALQGVDLILSAGDLPAKYLSFLTCFTNAPIIYVHGNHDDRYATEPPEGCLCADGTVVEIKGVRIFGLGGSIRYRPDGRHMYSEKEMASRIASYKRMLKATGGFDILLTHSPIRGFGDQEGVFQGVFQRTGKVLASEDDTHRDGGGDGSDGGGPAHDTEYRAQALFAEFLCHAASQENLGKDETVVSALERLVMGLIGLNPGGQLFIFPGGGFPQEEAVH